MSSLSQSKQAVFVSFHRYILSAQILLTATIWLIGEGSLRAINAEEGAAQGRRITYMSHHSKFCHIDSHYEGKDKDRGELFLSFKKCHNCMKFTQLVDITNISWPSKRKSRLRQRRALYLPLHSKISSRISPGISQKYPQHQALMGS